jgi:hypothetical protein
MFWKKGARADSLESAPFFLAEGLIEFGSVN